MRKTAAMANRGGSGKGDLFFCEDKKKGAEGAEGTEGAKGEGGPGHVLVLYPECLSPRFFFYFYFFCSAHFALDHCRALGVTQHGSCRLWMSSSTLVLENGSGVAAAAKSTVLWCATIAPEKRKETGQTARSSAWRSVFASPMHNPGPRSCALN